MNLFSWLKLGNNSEQVVALFDVRGASVGGALAVLSPNNKPEIVWSSREPIVLDKEKDPKRLEEKMFDIVRRMIKRIHTDGIDHLKFTRFGVGKVDQAHAFIASPWSISQTKILKIFRDQPILITDSWLEDLMKTEVDSFLEENRSLISSRGEGGVKLIEKKLIDIKLNGYETGKPNRKRASSVELALTLGVTGEKIVDLIQEVFRTDFGFKKITIHTYVVPAFLAVRDIYPEIHDFLLIDVGGESSEISLALKGVLLETISFPIGYNHLIRSVASSINSSLAVSLGAIRLELDRAMHSTDKTDSSDKRTLATIEKFRASWTKDFNGIVEVLSRDRILPKEIFISTEEDFRAIISPCIESASFSQFGLSDGTCGSYYLDSQSLSPFCQSGRKSNADPFLSLEAIFLNHIHRS